MTSVNSYLLLLGLQRFVDVIHYVDYKNTFFLLHMNIYNNKRNTTLHINAISTQDYKKYNKIKILPEEGNKINK